MIWVNVILYRKVAEEYSKTEKSKTLGVYPSFSLEYLKYKNNYFKNKIL